MAKAEAIKLPNAARHTLHKRCEKGDKFDPGVHNWQGRIILDVETQVKKGEKFQFTPTVKIPWMRVLVVALSRMGFQRDAIIERIIDTADVLLKMTPEEAKAFDVAGTDAEKLFNDRVKEKMAKQTKEGTTTWSGSVEVVEVTEVVR